MTNLKITRSIEEHIEQTLDYFLEENSFEDFLELFDITPIEMFMLAYESGLVNEDTLEQILI